MGDTMRRYRVGAIGDEHAPHGKYHAVKIYAGFDDCNDFIVKHLSDEDRAKFANCIWVPIEIHVNPFDMTIEGTFVPAVCTSA